MRTPHLLGLAVLKIRGAILLSLSAVLFAASPLWAADAPPPLLQIDAGNITAHVSPLLYGLMTEEINYSYDGGLYAELIRNRTFQDNARNPVNWSLTNSDPAAAAMSLDQAQPLNDALKTSLKLEITTASVQAPAGVANEGFWGIPVTPDTKYRASFYAKAAPGFTGPLTVAITSKDGKTTYATAQVPAPTQEWKKYEVTLTTTKVAPTEDAIFTLTTTSPGTLWLNLVSLFPPTWNDRPNGLRKDIMQLLADYKPGFLRFPGGNYLEGNAIANHFDWKITVGDISQRPTHPDDAWNYRSSDGLGLLEFLEWCDDLKMEPVMAVYAAFSMREHAAPDVAPYVQDALDEIEYAMGDTTTKWGALRAKDGHPAPFAIHYIEVGNEDNLNQGGATYNDRFAAFYDAIKAKYPGIQVIATTAVQGRTPDLRDDHSYFNSSAAARGAATRYDTTDHNGPKVMFGEYAAQTGGIQNRTRPETSSLENALDDAAFLTGLERNSDVVRMASYAPLFINMNPGATQWRTDLIGYDALNSFGSVSYYMQKMFSNNLGDVVLAEKISGLSLPGPASPTAAEVSQINAGLKSLLAQADPGTKSIFDRYATYSPLATPPPAPAPVPTLFYNATRDTKTGRIYLKVVNTAATPQPLRVAIKGVASVASAGDLTVLTSANPGDVNSLAEPKKVVPVTSKITDLGASFTRTFPPLSVSVLQIETK